MNDAFLETIKIVEGVAQNIEYHQARYESVLDYLGAKEKKVLSRYINAPKAALLRCRLVYDGSSIEVTYHEYKKREIESLKILYDDEIEYSMKYASREALDTLFGRRGDCSDVVIVKGGLITDTTIANIAFFDSKKWVTPKKPLLKGTTRQRLLDEQKIFEDDIKVDDIKKFSKVALMNAMIDFDIITKSVEEIFC